MDIQNASTMKELLRAAGLTLSQGYPKRLANTFVPVIETNANLLRKTTIIRAGTGTIYTTSATKDFFLTSASMETQSRDAAGAAQDVLTIIPFGETAARNILLLDCSSPVTGSTANNTSINFLFPMRLARNSAVVHSVNNSAGSATITGYEVEPFENL